MSVAFFSENGRTFAEQKATVTRRFSEDVRLSSFSERSIPMRNPGQPAYPEADDSWLASSLRSALANASGYWNHRFAILPACVAFRTREGQ